MLGGQDRWQEELFVACSMRDLVPEDHILKLVDKVLDLAWLRDEVRDLYSETHGRPSIDPEAAVRLMLAGFFEGVIHDRKLMRQAQVNIAIRWFAGYRLHEKLPDHSSLTRIRQRWGAERFRRIFQRTVRACVDAGLVNAETVHVDATLIRADVSWASIAADHAEKVLTENADDDAEKPPGRKKAKKRSATDPDATLTTSSSEYRMEPAYKQHTAVEDASGVIVDVDVTTGETSEGTQLIEQLDRVEATTGAEVKTVTADAGYAHSKNYAALARRDVEAVIPPQRERRKPRRIPISRFKYDAKHKVVRCPGGKLLYPGKTNDKGCWYRAKRSQCSACALRERCIPATARVRSILVVEGYASLLRARRRWRGAAPANKELYARHRWRSEGVHGEAKTQHGLRRAVRRGLTNVAIQVYLTAAVMNLKRPAAAARALPRVLLAVSVRCVVLLRGHDAPPMDIITATSSLHGDRGSFRASPIAA